MSLSSLLNAKLIDLSVNVRKILIFRLDITKLPLASNPIVPNPYNIFLIKSKSSCRIYPIIIFS